MDQEVVVSDGLLPCSDVVPDGQYESTLDAVANVQSVDAILSDKLHGKIGSHHRDHDAIMQHLPIPGVWI